MFSFSQIHPLTPKHLLALAHLRIAVFKEYPYLYQGHLGYEAAYLDKFNHSQQAYIGVVNHQNTLVGAITGLPLVAEEAALQAPWQADQTPIEGVFYISEVLLYPAFRHQGLGRSLFLQAEAFISAQQRYNAITFATVMRPAHHPLKPQGYRDYDAFWQSLGYQRAEGRVGSIAWQDIDETQESAKPMQFWVKQLNLETSV